ncbi:regulatory protein RecX [Limibacillus halophilus]|uniref:Regulatory protein RecX n=1 Tax=Limibacillus halophilus TaxID=1579333 RepID=A0A839SZ23_9PROT|nr:regulatory protein RecX [Limibacillus halophilus]MBB3066295.1 regulatory protein [Limibacillus halophilus]
MTRRRLSWHIPWMTDKDADDGRMSERRQGARRRRIKKVTPQYLERVGLWYLERYGSSSANFERVLWRRVERSAKEHGTDPEEGRKAIVALVSKLQRAGLLNDRAYAQSRARGLFRKGQSLKAIDQSLRQKGLAEEDRQAAIEQFEEADEDTDLAAAATYARRRRLGPYRPSEKRAETRERDLAALARRGFDYATAREVIDAEDPEILEAVAHKILASL